MKPFPSGLGVALVTPFDANGGIDFEALGNLVDHVIAGGVDYIVALGTTAETPTLSPEERHEVTECIRKRNAGRVPLVLGIGGNCTASVVRDIQASDLEGISAILSVTPFYNKPSQRGLYEHYKAVAGASELPVILYNVPGRTGVNMLPATTLKLAREFENIIAVKEASGNVAQFEELLEGRPDEFHVLSGDDSLALQLIERGGEGLISVAANAYPAQISAMIGAAMAQDRVAAEKIWRDMEPIVVSLFVEGNPTGIKAALSVKGLVSNVLRLPLVPASDKLYNRIKGLAESAGL